jgi:hypothetical protein
LFAAEDCADNICEKDGISVTVSKPHTSNAAAHGRFVLWAMPRAWMKVGRKEEATPNEEYKMAHRTMNHPEIPKVGAWDRQ